MKKLLIPGLIVLIVAMMALWLKSPEPGEKAVSVDITRVLSENESAAGFERADHPIQFSLPDDLGPHERFQTEWWYFTGNLSDGTGRPFGYQLTFFRRAISDKPDKGTSKWRTNNIFMAHFAISDINRGKFLSFERLSRGSLGMAGATAKPFRVWLENWQIHESVKNRWRLQAGSDVITIDLDLEPMKNMVLNGQEGLSRKGEGVGAASYYFSNTRIKSSGSLIIMGAHYQVTGFSWLDREWSTSVLGREQIGWDWFAIQLDDMREIMLYQIRKKGGGISRYSAGSLVDEQGGKTHLANTDFSITVTDYWKSAATKKRYPCAWLILIPKSGLEMSLKPLMKDQENRHRFVYWEGAVKASGSGIAGKGYVEMTGY